MKLRHAAASLLRGAIANIYAVLKESRTDAVAAEALFAEASLPAGSIRWPSTSVEACIQCVCAFLLFANLHLLADFSAVTDLRSCRHDSQKNSKYRYIQAENVFPSHCWFPPRMANIFTFLVQNENRPLAPSK